MYVTTGEVADFMYKCVNDDNICQEYKHRLVGISSGPAIVTTARVIVGLILLGAIATYYISSA